MSWQNILKINDATQLLREMLTSSRKITPEHDVKFLADLMVRAVRRENYEPQLKSIQNAVRQSLDGTWLDNEHGENMAQNTLEFDPSLQRALYDKGLSMDDVEWDEITPAVLSIYDKAIDALTEADLQ
jgi:hypothetical protein